jgi:hypothetical protein
MRALTDHPRESAGLFTGQTAAEKDRPADDQPVPSETSEPPKEPDSFLRALLRVLAAWSV